MDTIEKAVFITDDIINYIKVYIPFPLTYTELQEDGTKVVLNTEKGDEIFDKIYDIVKKQLENDK